MYPQFDLAGRVAVITGASKGIGFGLAKALAHAGAKVAVAARSREQLDQLVSEIRADGGDAAAFILDVRNVAEIRDVSGAVIYLASPQAIW